MRLVQQFNKKQFGACLEVSLATHVQQMCPPPSPCCMTNDVLMIAVLHLHYCTFQNGNLILKPLSELKTTWCSWSFHQSWLFFFFNLCMFWQQTFVCVRPLDNPKDMKFPLYYAKITFVLSFVKLEIPISYNFNIFMTESAFTLEYIQDSSFCALTKFIYPWKMAWTWLNLKKVKSHTHSHNVKLAFLSKGSYITNVLTQRSSSGMNMI